MTDASTRWPKPSDLPDIRGAVAVDTETSGLYADDGARTAVVSLAWIPDEIVRDDQPGGLLELAISHGTGVVSVAYPFDQGREGKPEDNGQIALFGEAENLDWDEWAALLYWLTECEHGYPAVLRSGAYAGFDPFTGLHGCGQCKGSQPKRRLVFHNAKFDWEKVEVGTRHWAGVNLAPYTKWDTMLACRQIWPTQPVALKSTAERLWGPGERDNETAIKTWLRKSKLPAGRYDLVPWDIIGPYAAKDTELTIRLAFYQWLLLDLGEFGGGGAYARLRRRHQFMRSLYRMEQKGLPYAATESREAAQELRARQRALTTRLPFKPTDPAAKQYYFGERPEIGADGKPVGGQYTARGVACLGLTPYSLTEKGGPQLTAEHLSDMALDNVPHAQTWLDWGKLDTAISMWYDGYAQAVGPDGRIRTSFRQTQVRSGRLSVERLNLQAIPHDYRLGDFKILDGVATPRELIGLALDRVGAQGRGWVAYEVDLAQAELRVAARFADCKRMLALIESGEDLHGDGVRSMFGIDKDSPKWFPFRQAMKRGNFSLIFGVGWRKLRADIKKNTGLRMGETEAQRFVSAWNGLYPEYQRAIDRWSRVVDRDRKIKLVNGEYRHFSAIEDTHKAFNQLVQASLAEFGLDWTLQTEQILAKYGVDEQAAQDGIGGAGLLLTVHDSQVLLLPRQQADEIVAEVTRYAREEGTALFGVPMDADYKTWGGE